ncbi:MAG: hypothetical protein ACTSV2_14740 [Candidatus Thorarchaeota archaeon]
MDIRTDCPYCSDNLDILQSELPTGPIMVECPSCGRNFEYIHGFGSYTLPRAGKGLKVDKKSEDGRGEDTVEVNDPKLPKVIAGAVILVMMVSGLSSTLIMFIPMVNLDDIILVILIPIIGFFIVVLFLYRAFNTIDE